MLELRFVDAENRDFHDLTAALDEYRRKGVASAVIAALEQDAAKHGFNKAILETARTTEDSAALYTKLGYRVIPYYGSPAGAENCLCFEKNLGD